MSEKKVIDETLPFEAPPGKYHSLGSHLPQDVFQELDSLPIESVTKHFPILITSLYNPPVNAEVAQKIEHLKSLPVEQFKAAWVKEFPTNAIEYKKFMDTLPISQASELVSLLQTYKSNTAAKGEIYRHTLSPHFVKELFQTPNLELAQAEFPNIPLERRTKWFDAASHFLALSHAEDESLRLKQCLRGDHTPSIPAFKRVPCKNAANTVESALAYMKNSMDKHNQCASLLTTLKFHMLDQPNFELAKINYAHLDRCVHATEVKADAIAAALKSQGAAARASFNRNEH